MLSITGAAGSSEYLEIDIKNARPRNEPTQQCLPMLLGDYILEFKPFPFSTVLQPAQLRLTVRGCSAGEVVRTQGGTKYTCQGCTAGTYSFAPEDPNGNEVACHSCSREDHAYCEGAAKIPNNGWWHSHPRSTQVGSLE
jgi:hypothetical protein